MGRARNLVWIGVGILMVVSLMVVLAADSRTINESILIKSSEAAIYHIEEGDCGMAKDILKKGLKGVGAE